MGMDGEAGIQRSRERQKGGLKQRKIDKDVGKENGRTGGRVGARMEGCMYAKLCMSVCVYGQMDCLHV